MFCFSKIPSKCSSQNYKYKYRSEFKHNMSMKGAIIGSTQIAVSHINAFSKNGLQIDSIASSQNSESAKKLVIATDLNIFQIQLIYLTNLTKIF